MDNSRDIDSVLMSIERSSGGIVSAMTFSARISFHILSFLYRQAQKGMVAMGFCDEYKNFMVATNGEFTTYNVPISTDSSKKIEKLQGLELELENASIFKRISLRNEIRDLKASIPEMEQLNKLGISYCVLPKLNGSLNALQVAVANKDDENFKVWFLNHINEQMKGGELSLEEMKVFTEGNYTLLNVPFENNSNSKELEDMLTDFKTMSINYAIMPDLKIGDGYTQIAVPNIDKEKVSQWFKLYNQAAVQKGEEIKEVTEIKADDYVSTSELNPSEYVKMADEQYQQIELQFEEESKSIPWSAKLASEHSPNFVKFLENSNYEKVTINIESLVNDRTITPAIKKFEEEGYFTARFPGAKGNKEKNLVLPKENVFITDEGKTVVAFLDKRKSYHVIASNGTVSDLKTNTILNKFDDVNRRFRKVNDFSLAPTTQMPKVAEKEPTFTSLLPK